ncbi:MAG: hypothetical protein BGO67_05045 [Alphaproteobacteria bacterium 41-28]|nr:MAG: hypothetical protein BGO67_05045 [Alphaproteobacteria bacterium 41-28]
MIVNYLCSALPYKTLVILISLFSFMMTPAFSMEDDIPKKTISKKKKIHSKKKKPKKKESKPKELDATAEVVQTAELLEHF